MRKKITPRKSPAVVALNQRSLKAVCGGSDITDGTEEARPRYPDITLKRG